MERQNFNQTKNFLSKIESDFTTSQSKLSMILGGLIILVIGILIFNYFSKGKSSLGPAQQTQQEQQQADVSTDNLPGQYTIKEGDTLFLIAEKYYKNGDKFNEIAKANKISDVNFIQTNQVLEIPKLAEQEAVKETATGGGNTTIWGAKISGDTYTVQQGDWLSTIAARAYGDIYSYQKIADANQITNPNLIEPGVIIKIPR